MNQSLKCVSEVVGGGAQGVTHLRWLVVKVQLCALDPAQFLGTGQVVVKLLSAVGDRGLGGVDHVDRNGDLWGADQRIKRQPRFPRHGGDAFVPFGDVAALWIEVIVVGAVHCGRRIGGGDGGNVVDLARLLVAGVGCAGCRNALLYPSLTTVVGRDELHVVKPRRDHGQRIHPAIRRRVDGLIARRCANPQRPDACRVELFNGIRDRRVNVADLSFRVFPRARRAFALAEPTEIKRESSEAFGGEKSCVELGLLFLNCGPRTGDNNDGIQIVVYRRVQIAHKPVAFRLKTNSG